jgi:hypothetical protein
MRKIADDEAKQLKHDVPKAVETEADIVEEADELERQLKDEEAHGHPANDVKLPKEEEDTDG